MNEQPPILTIHASANEAAVEKLASISLKVNPQMKKLKIYAGVMSVLIFFMAYGQSDSLPLAIFVTALFLAVFFWSTPRSIKKQSLKIYQSNASLQNLDYTLDFYDDHLVESSRKGTGTYLYQDAFQIVEDKDTLFFFISTNQAHVIPLAGLTPDERRFLEGLTTKYGKQKK